MADPTAGAMTDPAPVRSAEGSATRLGCGRDVDEVWDHIDEAPTDHEVGCPDCRAARTDLQALAEATSTASDEDRSDPGLSLAPVALDNIRAIVRSEVRRGATLPLLPVGAGGSGVELTISEQTVAAVVRAAADRVDGLEARRCRVSLTDATSDLAPDPTRPAGTVQPSTITITLGFAVRPGVSVPVASVAMREQIMGAISAEVGLLVSAVHLNAEDVLDG